MRQRLAIIGAGIAGLSLARALGNSADVRIFEKSRGLGGRMANRRREGYAFDHGAQFFTARSESFKTVIEHARVSEAVAPWPERVPTLSKGGLLPDDRPDQLRYVGTPGMNSLANALGLELTIRKEATVGGLIDTPDGWHLRDGEGSDLGRFDWVISTAPAPQTAQLMPDAFSGKAALERVRMSGCFTLMIGLEESFDPGFEAARIEDSVLSWIAVDTSKPGRGRNGTSLVLHSRNDWAEANLERERSAVTTDMLAAAGHLLGRDLTQAAFVDLHRWRYANVEETAGQDYLLDHQRKLAACGDWCRGNRVEAAVESAEALATALLPHFRG
ncbi:NAD(P)/FAD-dependent oxidoreductase [Rhizobium sp. G187]|uniref:NAD(P)/FAD-dependent oxidoreductase n=1 Tax=Rhizobium sp. G187 TaxID=3451352 RepID=UPI003EE4F96C